MEDLIKALKIIFLVIAILIGIGILGILFFVYKGIRSGDLASYVTNQAVETFIDESKLTEEQQEMLESGDYESLAEDLEENITDEQIDCAVQAVGEERARELMVTQDPTPQEVIKLSECL